MSVTTNKPWSLVFWDEVKPNVRRVPPTIAAAAIDAWFHDPQRRLELFKAWELLTGNRPAAYGGMNWMALHRALKPALVRAIEAGQLVMITDEGNEGWRRIKVARIEEAPPAPLTDQAKPTKTWIEFLVQDMAGQPLAGRKYRATLVDGTKKSGETDSKGLVRFDEIEPGLCEFVLEGLDENAWETADATDWIEFLVTDFDDKPLPDVRYEAKLTNGAKKTGVTGKNGLVRFDGLKSGICEFRLPDFDADETAGGAATDWVEFFVTGADGRPMADVEYEVVLTDRKTQTGKTDKTGLVRYDRLKTGKCEIRFLDVEAEEVGDEPPAAAGAAIEIELVDVDGKPRPGVRFVVEWSDGKKREGVTDENGYGRVDDVEEGEHTLTFPDHDASAWEAA